MKEFFKFCQIIFAVVCITFIFHISALKYLKAPIFENRIMWAYLANFTLALTILFALLNAPKRFKDNLGFLFMIGSGFKFVLFFIFFYPYYLADGNINKFEFAAFFVPYAACLISETKLLINKLSIG